jgi:dipeptidyl aminopeptidase/acylaminoacyl peptidase
MNKMRNLISVLLGLVALAGLAGGLAWLLGSQGALPGQQVSPVQTPTPEENGVVEITVVIQTPAPIPTPTLWPTPIQPKEPTPTPLPLRTPAPNPAGRIFYRAYPLTDESGFPLQAVDPIHAVEIDERGEFVSEVDLRWNQDDVRMYFDRMIPSPDGRYLAGIAPSEGGEYVFVVELTTGKFTLPDPGHVKVEGLMYRWHPNSNEILFRTINAPDRGLWLVDIHTGEHRLVAQPRPPHGISGAAISPDGRWLAYGYIPGATSSPSPYAGVWLAESDGRDAKRVVERSACVYSWSPDNRYFIYIGGREEKVTHEDATEMPAVPPFSVMDVRTGERRRLPVSRILGRHQTVWSPDGHSIAYAGLDGPEDKEAMLKMKNDPTWIFHNAGIYVVDVASGEVRRLASGIDPAWSPDGSMIAFSSLVDEQADIWVINADGTGLRQVTDTPEIDWRPVWVGQ